MCIQGAHRAAALPLRRAPAEMSDVRGGYLVSKAFWFQALCADRPGTCGTAHKTSREQPGRLPEGG